MINFVTALHCEAKPLIRHYNLTRETSTKFELYKNENINLIISGVGMLKSAIAATHLFSLCPDTKNSLAINLGICGSLSSEIEKGKMFVINKIINHSLKKSYYPDIIVRHGLCESSLETHPIPVIRSESMDLSSELVDMEAAGFMEAASAFFLSHNIYCLKIVSDHLEGERITPNYVSCLIEKNLKNIDNLIDSVSGILNNSDALLSVEDINLIEKISDNLNLTVTLRHQFKSLAIHYKIRTKNDLGCLNVFSSICTGIKDERKKYFESIKKLLVPG